MKTLKGKSPEHICYYIGLSITILCLILAALQTMGIFRLDQLFPPCFFYSLTHLPCPGCGMTRAIQAVFSFDFIASFQYNPVVLYCFTFFVFYMISHILELFLHHKSSVHHFHGMKLHAGYVYSGIAILLAQWIVKLLTLFF